MSQGDDIDHLTLFELYDWMCCICNTQIDKTLRFPDRMAATVEHLIPLSLGGTHTWDNVRPSHAQCNFDKADALTDASLHDTMALVRTRPNPGN